MAKTKISEFSANPANNTDIDSINIAEGCAPSGINDAIRELMAQLKDFQAGTAGDSFNGPIGTTTAAAGSFTTLSASGAVTLSGGTANGVAYLNGSKVLTTGTGLQFDGSNLGLGVTPSAWSSAFKALQLSSTSITNNGSNDSFFGANYFFDGSNNRYINSDFAATYGQVNGQHLWYTAPSGTAGNAISFSQAMTLDSSGNLLVGTTSLPLVSNTVTGVGIGSAVVNQYATSNSSVWGRGNNGAVHTFKQGTTTVGSISITASATAYNTSSDYRLKNITGPITTSGAYIDSLNPVEGTWKADGSTFVGLIAHEVQEASRTNVATGVKDGEEMQGMDYSSAEIIANLIAEVKSLRQRLAAAGI